MSKWILLLSICVASPGTTVGEAEDPLRIGDRRQVFIDGRLIKESRGIELLVHRPQKTGEIVIKCEYPWEERLGQYHSVLKDGNIYHMWYTVYGKADNEKVPVRSIAYARSKDGIHWEKPNLGLVEVYGTNHQTLGYRTPAEVYGVAVGTPVALWAPSVPTALTYGDESTLKTPSFCLDNG